MIIDGFNGIDIHSGIEHEGGQSIKIVVSLFVAKAVFFEEVVISEELLNRDSMKSIRMFSARSGLVGLKLQNRFGDLRVKETSAVNLLNHEGHARTESL